MRCVTWLRMCNLRACWYLSPEKLPLGHVFGKRLREEGVLLGTDEQRPKKLVTRTRVQAI